MNVELMTLGFLMSGPKTGYRLKKICDKMALFYGVNLNQIYPVLRKLEAEEYVKKEVVIQENRPNKHVYTVTEKGKRHFREMLTAEPVPLDYKLDFFVRALFFRFIDQKIALAQFEKEITLLSQQLDELEKMHPLVEQNADENGYFVYRAAAELTRTLLSLYQKELARRKNEAEQQIRG